MIGGTEVWTEAGYSRIASTSGAYSPHSLEIQRANARLIASAPALLAVCKLIAFNYCPSEYELVKMRKLARAAIADVERGTV